MLYLTGATSNFGVNNLWLNLNGTDTRESWVGGIDIRYGTSDPQNHGDPRVVFCLELFVKVGVGKYNTVVDYADTARLEEAAWLLTSAYPTSANMAAGLQLAIWDIMEDGMDGFSAGKLRQASGTDANVLGFAKWYEAKLIPTAYYSTNAYIYENTDSNGVAVQDFIGVAPEPAAIALMVSGLILIGLGRLRRRAPR
jgi:hypothetical protein